MPESPPQHDPNGYMRYSIGLTAVVIAITAVAAANLLGQAAQNGNLPMIAFLSPKAAPPSGPAGATGKPSRFDNIDYDATGSIQNFLQRPVILDPCTGRQK